MKIRKILRLISLVMLIVAVGFVFYALSHPELGEVIYIGKFVFGSEQWRFCYKAYVLVAIALFFSSFFIKDKN